MVKYSYINEAGYPCEATINEGTFDVYIGKAYHERVYKKSSEVLQKEFSDKLKNCKKVRQSYVHDN